MGPGYDGQSLAEGIESAGGEAVRVDASQDFPNQYVMDNDLPHPLRVSDYHLFCARKRYGGYCDSQAHAKRLVYGFEHVKVNRILREIPPVDGILLTQPTFLFDVRGVNVPVFYYLTRATRIWWPRGPVAGLFYGYRDLRHYFKEHRPFEFFSCDFHEFVPVGFDAGYYSPPFEGHRPVRIGFMGTRNRNDDWFSQQLYILRNYYVDYAAQHLYATTLKARNQDVYRKFLQRCNLALNVAVCGANMRQFEAPACGAVLLQLANQDSQITGLVDKENCLLFQNERELKEKVLWSAMHPAELEEIRHAGREYAIANSFQARGKTIYKCIADYYLNQGKEQEHEVNIQNKVDAVDG